MDLAIVETGPTLRRSVVVRVPRGDVGSRTTRAVDIAYSLMLSFFYHATLSNEINVLNTAPFFFFFFYFCFYTSNSILSPLYKSSILFLNSLVCDRMRRFDVGAKRNTHGVRGSEDNIMLSARNNVTSTDRGAEIGTLRHDSS